MNDDTYSALATSALFSSRDMRRLRKTLSTMDMESRGYGDGETILQEGFATLEILVVTKGEVELTMNGTVLRTYRRSETIAAALSLSAKRSSFSLMAKGQTEIVAVKRDALLAEKEFKDNLMAMLAKEALDEAEEISVLRQPNVRERVLAYLRLEMAKHHGNTIILPFSKKEFACRISVSVEALTKTLSAMKEEGILKVERNRYTLSR